MKRYEEAEKVKMKADLLEEFERNKLEAEVILIYLSYFTFLDVSYNRKERSKVETCSIVSFSSIIEKNIKR
jgi:hypothetical protein